MTELHVGYVLKVYPRFSETFIVNEILELERQGARVTVFSLRLPREGRFHSQLAQVAADVHYLPDLSPGEVLRRLAAAGDGGAPDRVRLGDLAWDEIAREGSRGIRHVGQALALRDLARELGVRHLHAHFGTSATTVARLASRVSGIPFSFTAHAKDIYLEANPSTLLAGHVREASFVVTVCRANRDHLQRLPAGDTPIHVIYNGLDLETFQPRPRSANGTFEILSVGRLVPKKGLDTLLRACRILSDRGLAFRCRIVGQGEEEENLRALAAELELGDRVEIPGPWPSDRVRSEMATADVFALPARVADDGNRDALPTVLLEAAALELPSVSTPVTGIPEILGDDEAGILVPVDKPEALAEALARLAEDPVLRRRLGQGGRRRALERFDVKVSVRLLLDRFRESAEAAEGEPAFPHSAPSLPEEEVSGAARLP
jgi:glycosyltransferase involved in cell wall biosynthesis